MQEPPIETGSSFLEIVGLCYDFITFKFNTFTSLLKFQYEYMNDFIISCTFYLGRTILIGSVSLFKFLKIRFVKMPSVDFKKLYKVSK